MEGFNSIHIVGIQIFDGESAIQPVSLIPMLKGQANPSVQVIYIGRHAVAMKEPRNQMGPVIEPRIFRQVIIPNPITVHLGTPGSSAQNVQASFTDYIKNVASSEILSHMAAGVTDGKYLCHYHFCFK